MATYTEHCNKSVYPLFEGIYNIKRGDNLEQVKNTLLYYASSYISDLDSGIFGCELMGHCKTILKFINNKNSIVTRKHLNVLIISALIEAGSMLKEHNILFPENHIYNFTGRIKQHYLY